MPDKQLVMLCALELIKRYFTVRLDEIRQNPLQGLDDEVEALSYLSTLVEYLRMQVRSLSGDDVDELGGCAHA